MNQDKSIKNELMKKIKKDEIKMTSRWVCIAQKIGLKSGLALTILVIAFLLNALLFFIKSNSMIALDYNQFSIWQNIFYSLPYDLIFLIIALIVIINFVIKKFDFYLKVPFILVVASFTCFVLIFAGILFSTNLNERIKNNLTSLEKNNLTIPYLTNFYVHRCGHCNFRTKSLKDVQKMLEECPLNKIK